jgi:5-(carboxyamino)imidazole ribonucleotide mutase
MPSGVPVATVALDGGRNAGILAAQMVAIGDDALMMRLMEFKEALKAKVESSIDQVENHTPKA